jgi:hypothetical protein
LHFDNVSLKKPYGCGVDELLRNSLSTLCFLDGQVVQPSTVAIVAKHDAGNEFTSFADTENGGGRPL